MAVNKKVLAVVAAGALTAASAVPALAFENEFHGMFQLQYDNSNFNGTDRAPAEYVPEGKDKKAPTANFFEQRARLAYIAKANDNLKLVTKFELDYTFWGNASYTTHRNEGGALGADSVNLETKNAYLDMNFPSVKLNTRLGMQPIDDSFKGIIVSGDMAGLLFTHSYDKATATAGYFRWNDSNSGAALGKDARDFIILDGKYSVNKDLKVGGAYYYITDNQKSAKVPAHVGIDDHGNVAVIPEVPAGVTQRDFSVHTIGANAEATFGPATIDGFLIGQFGNLDTNTAKKDLKAFAANVGAKVKVGKGTARSEFLYASGEGDIARGTSNAFLAEPQGQESGFYNNEMVILGRDKYAMTNDSAIVYDANNKQQGVIFGSLGYDHPCTDKLTTSLNLGFAAVAKENTNKPLNTVTGKRNDSNYLGTEVNVEANYKLFENVTLIARGGYVFLGDYYKDVATNGTPDNPYDLKLIANYSF